MGQGTNPTYIGTRFALVQNGVPDFSKLPLSSWGYVESSTEVYDDGGASNPVCILNTGDSGALVRLIANGPLNNRNTTMAGSTPLSNKAIYTIGTYLTIEEL